ncbi:DUF4163 domain-containing protein [Caproiciproducens galactitolivorans]|uniref:Deacetylase PdaC domain-containing protein n=1 Tax=Caproiciproducens galactitolivorans TaxID=642589 RepID=A0A4Z0Y0S6_9FIRM|nr:hypothetical protein [Caproiciproducens galactitolivorans]QEY35615.1 DUF4163 domain-containing protein [Caproiciproducens galactitolivorans]TGJ77344.1 hypothetical protein CAGA_07130 [Caproiciproducens galactitolivorans]
MKKLYALILALTMVVSMSACKGGQVSPTQNETASGAVVSGKEASNPASSLASVPAASSNSDQKKVASEEIAKIDQPKTANSKAVANLNKGTYTVKEESYSYKNDNNAFTATYPVLSGKIPNVDKINATIKSTAMKTINSMGTSKKKNKTTVRVSGEVAYEGKNFISIGFNEYVKVSTPKAKPTRTLRVVNINLNTGTVLSTNDLIVKNDALCKTLESVRGQLSGDVAPYITADVIKSALDSGAVYFSKYGVGFGLQVNKPDQRLIKLVLTYEQMKPYMTNNEIWKNFK